MKPKQEGTVPSPLFNDPSSPFSPHGLIPELMNELLSLLGPNEHKTLCEMEEFHLKEIIEEGYLNKTVLLNHISDMTLDEIFEKVIRNPECAAFNQFFAVLFDCSKSALKVFGEKTSLCKQVLYSMKHSKPIHFTKNQLLMYRVDHSVRIHSLLNTIGDRIPIVISNWSSIHCFFHLYEHYLDINLKLHPIGEENRVIINREYSKFAYTLLTTDRMPVLTMLTGICQVSARCVRISEFSKHTSLRGRNISFLLDSCYCHELRNITSSNQLGSKNVLVGGPNRPLKSYRISNLSLGPDVTWFKVKITQNMGKKVDPGSAVYMSLRDIHAPRLIRFVLVKYPGQAVKIGHNTGDLGNPGVPGRFKLVIMNAERIELAEVAARAGRMY